MNRNANPSSEGQPLKGDAMSFPYALQSFFKKSLLLILLPATGCVFYESSPPPAVNEAPWYSYADAGCFWDRGYQDFIFYFDVDVKDDLGAENVAGVWVDVYDDATGGLSDSFELNPEPGQSWYSSWLGSTTYLDPHYGGYTAAIQAEDSEGAIGETDIAMIPCD